MSDVVIFADTTIYDFDSESVSKWGYTGFEQPLKGAGPYRIATEVRSLGLSCQVVHFIFHCTQEEIETICNKFITKETLLVGFSTTFWNSSNINHSQRKMIISSILSHSRKLGIKIALGGTLSNEYCDIIKADISINGFGETTFIDYLKSLMIKEIPRYDRVSSIGTPILDYKKDDTVFDFNHSQIKYVDEDCLEQGESVTIEVARGCIFKCSFCFFPLNGKDKIDYIKDATTLRNELIYNYEKYNITEYTFADDTFNDSTYKIELLHKIFTSLPFKIKFTSYLRLDLLHAHQEQIPLLKEMGLVGTFFGVETLNYEAAKKIGKGMKPEKVKELLYDLKKHHWKNDVNISIGLISGLPGETAQSHKETIDWVLDEKYCLVDKIKSGGLFIPNPLLSRFFQKSQFELEASKHGFYWPEKNSNDWKNLSSLSKSRKEALSLAVEINDAAYKTSRIYKGNFSIMLAANCAKYSDDPKTLEQLNQMDRKSYEVWFLKNYKQMCKSYIDNYKNQIINLN